MYDTKKLHRGGMERNEVRSQVSHVVVYIPRSKKRKGMYLHGIFGVLHLHGNGKNNTSWDS